MAPTPKTLTYKTASNLGIPLDVYLPSNASNVPILLWFHGGGLLQGHRSKIAPHMLRSVEKYKHCLVSADYRLAPQVGIQEIFEDVRDCVTFVRSKDGLSKALGGEGSVDPGRLAVSGSSAGGYLAFLAGLYCEPKPQLLLPIYPITDPLGTFFTNPQPAPTLKNGEVDFTKKISDHLVAPFTDHNAPVVANNDPGDRDNMYAYMMDRANLASLLHLNTTNQPYHDTNNDRWRIAKQIKARGLPPTYVVHGDLDRAVGIEQADEVVGLMVGLGMEVRYERVGEKDHLWDQFEEGEELEGLYGFMHGKFEGKAKI